MIWGENRSQLIRSWCIRVLKIAKLKFCDILDLKFAIYSEKDLTTNM